MNAKFFSKLLAMTLAVMMLLSVLPMSALALSVDYTEREDDYYKLITQKDYDLAPGIVESEIVLDNSSGSHRQVAHVVEVDLSNPYAKVIPSYKGMVPTPGSYGVQIMSEQAKFAEANGYGNVVAAMNLSLSWYDNAYYESHPELVGEPLGYMVLDGQVYVNSQGQTSGAQTCVVINFDEKNGEKRPADMPKVAIRSTADEITGWEEQVIPANFGFLVKDGKNQYAKNHTSDPASRSFVGVKADGTFVMVMNDGRQAPYSTGFNNYEMAEFMLSLGCVVAVNGDGGGSSAFLSQRPGEELKINCSPSDGAERPTTHGILVISTAPASGEFVRANITAEHKYYAPGSTVTFSALGTDLVGTVAEIPEDAVWRLADESFGSIEDGVFVSNGKEGTVTVQMVYKDKVVGEASIEVVMPEVFKFSQRVIVVPFGATVNIGMTATIHDGLHEVAMSDEQISLSMSDEKLGTINGLTFSSAISDENLSSLEGVMTAKLNGTNLTAQAKLKLGAPSEVLYDFEEEADVDDWKTGVVNGHHTSGFEAKISHTTADDGKVHNGNGALRWETNGLSAESVSAGGYAQVPIYLKDGIIVKDALSIGFWAYIPDEYEHCWIRVLYFYDSDGNGTYDKKNTITVINQPEVYNTWDESGWKYFSVDVSAYSSILIPGVNDPDTIFPAANHPNKGTAKEPNDYRFIELMFPHTSTNDLWKNFGSINGPYTLYIDNITADYSEAVDDREEPIFKNVSLITGNDSEIALEKYKVPVTDNNVLNVTTRVVENETRDTATGLDVSTAKAFVDGVEVDVTYTNGLMAINNVAVADGVHRVKFEIADKAGNKSVVIRLIKVASGKAASTIQFVPADASLDRLYGGSLYWMNLDATAIETVQSVKTVVDINNTNHWELDHMELAEGFTAEYSVDAETNTATIEITRTGENTQTGKATLASLPIRILYYDTDIHINGHTAQTYWKSYDFWPYDLKVDVDMGVITYMDGYNAGVLNVFSNEEFSVDTEMYTVKSQMDTAFFAERGTAHVHTAQAVDNKAATCTENGFTDRTYCEVCDSVVDWGTTVAATGHSYVLEDGMMKCACGKLFNGEKDGLVYVDGVLANGWSGDFYYRDGAKLVGAHEIEGVFYNFAEDGKSQGKITGLFFDEDAKVYRYAIVGAAKSGWFMIENDWHYFRTGTLAAATGTRYYFADFPYEFDETGKLLHVVWRKYADSYRCYYGPTFYSGTEMGTWTMVEGKQYCFAPGGLVLTGYQVLHSSFNAPYYVHQFDSKGVYIGRDDHYNGFIYGFDGIRYVVNGEMLKGLQIIDGNYYYFSSTTGAARTGKYTVTVTNSNGLLTQNTTFNFDENTGAAAEKPLNGFVKKDGNTYYYINNEMQKGLQLIEDKYYYFSSNTGAMRTGKYTVTVVNSNGLLDKNTTFNFDVETGAAEIQKLNGFVKKDGNTYYYINNEMQKGLQLIDGNYYYFSSNTGAMRTGKYTVTVVNSNGLLDKNTTFNFDTVTGAAAEKPLNGFVKQNGNTYYYINNMMQKGLQLIDGNYYYFSSNTGAMRTGKYTVTVVNSNGMLDKNTTFNFDTVTGAAAEKPLNGFVKKDGNTYYYINNMMQKGLQLIDGNYYYFSSNTGAMRTGKYTVTVVNSNGMLTKNTAFLFDAVHGYAVDENGNPLKTL